MIRVFLSRALGLVFRRRRDEIVAEEIQLHLDQLTDDYVKRGMTLTEAQAAARRAFGGIEQTKEAYRDQSGLPFVDAFVQDVRFAVRLLRRDRAFSLTAVLVLGLGIGVNNMLFTIVNAHTLRGLPIDHVERVVYISTFDDRAPDRGLSYADFEDLRNAARHVSLAAFVNAPIVVAEDNRVAERLDGAFISQNAFDLLGAEPVLGRGFSPNESRPGAEGVAILGSGVWTSRYGADRNVLGRSIRVDGRAAVIVGVMPADSGFPSSAEVWLPLAQMPGLTAQARDARTLSVFGRMADGVTLAEAKAEIESVVERLSRDHPDTSRNVRARVVPINERFLGRLTDPAWLAFMTVGCLVVLISCANVANLVLANAARRAREIAIRSSLGASRRRVLRQLLIEGTVLAAVGGALGMTLAMGGVRLFRTAVPPNVLPYWLDYTLDVRVFLALVAVSVATVFVFGFPTALHSSKTDVIVGTQGRRAISAKHPRHAALEHGIPRRRVWTRGHPARAADDDHEKHAAGRSIRRNHRFDGCFDSCGHLACGIVWIGRATSGVLSSPWRAASSECRRVSGLGRQRTAASGSAATADRNSGTHGKRWTASRRSHCDDRAAVLSGAGFHARAWTRLHRG